MGRPTKCNPEIEKKICDALRIGATRTAAYGAAHVSHTSFLEWLKRFPAFLASVTHAEAEAELRFTAIVTKAAQDGDAKYALEWLKRRRKYDWGITSRSPQIAELTSL